MILSESIAISLSVLMIAAALAIVRNPNWRSLTAFLSITLLWTFSRQDQALEVLLLAVPFLVLGWRRPHSRRLATIGCVGILVIGVWGTATVLQTTKQQLQPGRVPSQIQLAGIIQFRVAANKNELTYFWNHGLPHTSALKIPPPFTSVGEMLNVNQFGDPFAEYRLATNPEFKRWETTEGQRVLLTYLLTHPWSTIAEPLEHAPQIMTMNPDYGWTAALPQWASTMLYGDFASALAPNLPSGPPRSSDPLYFFSLLAIGAVLFVCVAFKRQRRSQINASVWVAVWTLGFVAIWAVEIWNLAAGDLAREFIVAGVVSHIALILLIMGCVDSLMSSSLSRKTWRAGRSAGEARYPARSSVPTAVMSLSTNLPPLGGC